MLMLFFLNVISYLCDLNVPVSVERGGCGGDGQGGRVSRVGTNVHIHLIYSELLYFVKGNSVDHIQINISGARLITSVTILHQQTLTVLAGVQATYCGYDFCS